MPLFSPGSSGRRRETSAGAPCRRAANRARGLSHRPRLRTHGGLGSGRYRSPEQIRTDFCGVDGRFRRRRILRADLHRAPGGAVPRRIRRTTVRWAPVSRPGPAVPLRRILNLIGGSEARVDFVYTRRAPAVCPRPAGRLTRADLPVHHRSCRSTTVPASGVTCGLCGRTECTERLLVAAEYPATTVYLECSGPCGGSTAPMWAPVDAA